MDHHKSKDKVLQLSFIFFILPINYILNLVCSKDHHSHKHKHKSKDREKSKDEKSRDKHKEKKDKHRDKVHSFH